MASIKLQLVHNETERAHDYDFRGEKFVGSAQGDEHKTIFEIDPATDEEVTAVENAGSEINAVLGKMSLQGLFLRVGLFDGTEQ